MKTGNCTLMPNAMVYKVLMDPVTHKAKGVLYIDRVTREPKEVLRPRVILSRAGPRVGAHPAQLDDRQAPNGLANSSGVLGHYLMDHLWVAGGASGRVPGARDVHEGLGQQPRPARTAST